MNDVSERLLRAVKGFALDEFEDEFVIAGTDQAILSPRGRSSSWTDGGGQEQDEFISSKQQPKTKTAGEHGPLTSSRGVILIASAVGVFLFLGIVGFSHRFFLSSSSKPARRRQDYSTTKQRRRKWASRRCTATTQKCRRADEEPSESKKRTTGSPLDETRSTVPPTKKNHAVVVVPPATSKNHSTTMALATKGQQDVLQRQLRQQQQEAKSTIVPNAVPDLAQEETNRENELLAGAYRMGESLALSGKMQKKTPEEAAREVAANTKIYQREMKAAGIEVDDAVAASWAAGRQRQENEAMARDRAECRGYLWDGEQRRIDRAKKDRQHRENLAAAREEKEWLAKLYGARDRAYNAVSAAFMHGVIGFTLVFCCSLVGQVHFLWNDPSRAFYALFAVVCPVERIDPGTRTAWFLSYITSAPVDTLPCLFDCGLRMFVLALVGFCLVLMNQIIFIPAFVVRLVTSIVVAVGCWSAGVATVYHCAASGMVQIVLSLVCLAYLRAKFHRIRTGIEKSGTTPSTAVLNEKLHKLDEVAGVIAVTPVVVLIAACFIRYYFSNCGFSF